MGFHLFTVDLVTSKLKEGLSSSNFDEFRIGLLLARQICLDAEAGSSIFPSYRLWFQRTFGVAEGTSLTFHRRDWHPTLVQFLTQMVPYEQGSHLQAHMQNPPFLGPGHKDLWRDYVMLAKTRLFDLMV